MCARCSRTAQCPACPQPGTCATCKNLQCSAGTYRAGECKDDTTQYSCEPQPTCNNDKTKYVAGASTTNKGTCTTCSNLKCSEGTYRAGECKDDTTQYRCEPQPTCDDTDKYLADASATKKGTCTECRNLQCSDGTYRAGQCSDKSNQYRCDAQPACNPNTEYLAGASTTAKGECTDRPVCSPGP